LKREGRYPETHSTRNFLAITGANRRKARLLVNTKNRPRFGKFKGLRGAKLGNPNLRWAFGEAAVIAKRDHKLIGPLAQSLEKRLGNKFKANTVIAIKLARAVYYMLLNKTVFDPDRLVAALDRK
jgi:hypothetical protein